MSYSKLSTGMAHYISQEIGYDSEKEEVIAYSIENILLNIMGVILVSIIGFITRSLLATLVAAFSGATLRKMSGGTHASSAAKCLTIGSISYSIIGVLANYLSLNLNSINIFWLLAVNITILTIVIIYAPVDCPAKPIHSKSLRKKLKIASVFFVITMVLLTILINNDIVKIAITLGMFYQSLTLLPILNKRR